MPIAFKITVLDGDPLHGNVSTSHLTCVKETVIPFMRTHILIFKRKIDAGFPFRHKTIM